MELDMEKVGTLLALVAASSGLYYFLKRKASKNQIEHNLDTGEDRRQVPGRFLVTDEELEEKGIERKCSYIINNRGQCLHTMVHTPKNKKIKGLVLYLHGYADNISWINGRVSKAFAEEGYEVYQIEYEGHGSSDGLHVHIENFDNIVVDVMEYFTPIRNANKEKKAFLVGESMGGAVGFLLTTRYPCLVDGACFVAPMVKIKEDVKPPALIISILTYLAHFFPTLPATPSAQLIDKCYNVEEKRELVRSDPIKWKKRHRLWTALEMMRVTDYLNDRLEDLETPFIIVHGEADVVTCPSVSEDLYNRARSKDKTLKLYPGGCHACLVGDHPETEKNIYSDLFEWLSHRC